MHVHTLHLPLSKMDCQHDTGFTGCHTDNPAITPSETRLSTSTPALALALSLAKFQQLNILYLFFMDIYVCAARRSSILRVSFVAPRSPGRPFRGCCRSNNVVERQSASRAIRTSQLPSARAMNSRKLDRQTYNRGWTAQAGDGGSYRLYRVRRIE